MRLASAEERGKEAREIAVDRVEGLLQEIARLAVDLADRAFERLHRLVEIARLRVEVLLALGGLRDPLDRRHIDRTERGDRLRQALDLGREAAGASECLELVGERRQIGLAVGERLRELLAGKTRRLLLQAHVL